MFTCWVGPAQCKKCRESAGCQWCWEGEGVRSDDAEDAGHALSAVWEQPRALGERVARPWRAGQCPPLAVLGWLGVIRRLRVSTYLFLLMAISFSVVSDYDLHMC